MYLCIYAIKPPAPASPRRASGPEPPPPPSIAGRCQASGATAPPRRCARGSARAGLARGRARHYLQAAVCSPPSQSLASLRPRRPPRVERWRCRATPSPAAPTRAARTPPPRSSLFSVPVAPWSRPAPQMSKAAARRTRAHSRPASAPHGRRGSAPTPRVVAASSTAMPLGDTTAMFDIAFAPKQVSIHDGNSQTIYKKGVFFFLRSPKSRQ